mgnify:CR=1 FL=1
MTQYMLSVHPPQEVYDYPPERAQAQWDATGVFNQEIVDEGVWVFTGGLKRTETATTVDGTGDEVVVTDGPYAETKEHLGGFWIVDVPDMDAALALAVRASKACGDTVEVRPFQEGE